MLSKEEILKKRSSSQEDKEKEGRHGWIILALLLISSGLAAIFYLFSFWPDFWQKIMTPRVIRPQEKFVLVSPTDFELTPTPWQEDLKEELFGYINQENGFYGIYLYQVSSQQFIGVNHQESFPAASLMKLPIIVAAYQQAEKQQFDLTSEYRLREEDKLIGNGSVYLQPEGTVYSYRNLIKLAIEQSDNTAVNVIAKILGEEKIRLTIDFLGLEKTDYTLHQTSPEDIGRLLIALHQGEVLTSAHSQEIIGYLSQTIFNDQIPAVLPKNLTIAHKIGLDNQVLHDAAIIFTDQEDFVLVIMSQGDSQDQEQRVLEKITETVWKRIGNSS
ncbi:MAG: class A beta-lactamase-related serine hydrolase [Candidatus Shapirobacteria bacterium]|nr:class A beta-lactamase-related serine hydrolase [Candidatus Shapirobacteria bacterium]